MFDTYLKCPRSSACSVWSCSFLVWTSLSSLDIAKEVWYKIKYSEQSRLPISRAQSPGVKPMLFWKHIFLFNHYLNKGHYVFCRTKGFLTEGFPKMKLSRIGHQKKTYPYQYIDANPVLWVLDKVFKVLNHSLIAKELKQ